MCKYFNEVNININLCWKCQLFGNLLVSEIDLIFLIKFLVEIFFIDVFFELPVLTNSPKSYPHYKSQ